MGAAYEGLSRLLHSLHASGYTARHHYVSVSRRMGIKSEIAGQSESSGNHSVSVEATQRVALLRYIRVEAISRT